mgnify:CR=1 FL=1
MTQKFNNVNAYGNTKAVNRLVEDIAFFALDEILPKFRTLHVDITMCPLANHGNCLMTNSRREYEIQLNENDDLNVQIITLCHELVHVKQYVRKEIDPNYHKDFEEKYSKVKYEDLPWEKEAYGLEKDLAIKSISKAYQSLHSELSSLVEHDLLVH